MSRRFEQPSLDGLDLEGGRDEELAELPLERSPPVRRGARAPRVAVEEGDPSRNLDLFAELTAGDPEGDDGDGDEVEAAGDEARHHPGRETGAPGPVPEWLRPEPQERLLGGLADLTVHLGVLAAALLAMSGLSLRPDPAQWPGFLAFLLCFSFLYHVVPLAFWGQTPGMAWRGLRARARGGEPLSFGQAGLRWASALVTASLLGLPLLLAFGERGSLSDLVTRSRTWRRAS